MKKLVLSLGIVIGAINWSIGDLNQKEVKQAITFLNKMSARLLSPNVKLIECWEKNMPKTLKGKTSEPFRFCDRETSLDEERKRFLDCHAFCQRNKGIRDFNRLALFAIVNVNTRS